MVVFVLKPVFFSHVIFLSSPASNQRVSCREPRIFSPIMPLGWTEGEEQFKTGADEWDVVKKNTSSSSFSSVLI